jgi:hypothetical protein
MRRLRGPLLVAGVLDSPLAAAQLEIASQIPLIH